MFQIDGATAAAARPAPAAVGVPGFFTEGDAVAGTPATIVSADFLNSVMMELVSVLLGVGAAPSKASVTQLRDSLPKLNPAARGSAVFPSGLILNWGNDAQADNSGAKAVVFDTPFTQGLLAPLVINNANGPPAAFHGVGGGSKTGMTVYSAGSSGQAALNGTAFWWLAIGR